MAYSGKLRKYLKEAQEAGIVTLTGKDNTPTVSLHPKLAATIQSSRPAQPTNTASSLHVQMPAPTSSAQISRPSAQSRAKFAPLLDVLRTIAVPAGTMVDNSDLGTALKKKKFSYVDAGYARLLTYIEAAEAEGLVKVQRKSGVVCVGLAPAR
jgi:hypothetical protein